MTDGKIAAWIEEVWASLRTMPTGTSGDQLEAAWNDHKRRRLPVAAIFGAYDAGKSSLLKRLLFEDGVKIPEWLTVSSRRETFSVDEVDGEDWTYRDSPGIAGGNAEHDNKALSSLDLADLIIWVLPPQLVTSSKGDFDSIVTGERFGLRPEHVSESLMAIISRSDEAGIDPATNPRGFSDLCARKKSEFTSLLSGVGVAPPRWRIFMVGADPYQGVGNEAPDASVYALGDGWDGMPELRAALKDTARQAAKLRTLAGFRYASGVVRDLSSSIRNERTEREEALQTVGKEVERLVLWATGLQALRSTFAAELHRVVEDELLSAGRTGTAAAAHALEKKLAAAIDRWSDQAYAELEKLASSAEKEIGQRARSASMERLKRLILELSDAGLPEPKPNGDGRILKYGGRLSRSFREGFKAYARVDLGMSLDEAARHVRDWQKSGIAWAEYSKAKGKYRTFASEFVANKASSYVKWTQALDTFAPVLEQIGTLLYDVADGVLSKIEADKMAKRRGEVREALKLAAHEVESEAITGFDEAASNFSSWLAEQERLLIALQSSFEAQVAALRVHEAALQALMCDRPA
jgi:hypothetical protein